MDKKRVAIIGIGTTAMPNKCRPRQSFKEMVAEGVYDAIEDAGIDASMIEAACIAFHGEGILEHGGIGPLLADYLGICPAPVYMTNSNCTGSAVCLNQAHDMIASGRYNCMLVAGFDKMTDIYNYVEIINASTDADYDYSMGITHGDGLGMMSMAYNQKYDVDDDAYVEWSYNMQKYGRMYDKTACYGKPMPTKEQLEEQPFGGCMLTWGEGCAAAILVSEELAEKYTKKPVWLSGVGYSAVPHYYGNRYDSYPGVAGYDHYDIADPIGMLEASKEAYAMAHITPDQIDVAQVYDICGVQFYELEGLQICPIGTATKFVLDGNIALGGKCPTNTDGGNIARGHCSGADGVQFVIELVRQLRGEAGQRQVENAKVGVAADIGGACAHNTVIVVTKD